MFTTETAHQGRGRRGQGLQRDGDGSGEALDIARRQGDKRAAREKKAEALERTGDMPKWWSPRALVHTVHDGRSSYV